MVYNYQVFQNVATKEDFLGNIKNVATANGWVCDKDDISATGELYLHSLGDGNQKLYYSFKTQAVNWASYYYTRAATAIRIFANTGFNTNLAVDAQPGKWSQTALSLANGVGQPSSLWYAYGCFSLLGFPMSAQYVFANSQMVLCFCDIFTSVFQPVVFLKPRFIKHLGFGAIDSYKGSSETEGNYLFADWYGNFYADITTDKNKLYSAIFGAFTDFHSDYFSHPNYDTGVLYSGANRFDINCGVSTPYIIRIDNTITNITEDTNYAYGRKGYRYNWAIQYNSWASRFSLIKPILSVSYSDATNIYFYPIGELPYYACKAYPYAQTGGIVYYGSRKFMVFPILYNENDRGVAVEIV